MTHQDPHDRHEALFPLPVDPSYTPEQKLLLAVVVGALADAMSGNRDLERNALSYLYPGKGEGQTPFSFRWCAEHLVGDGEPEGFMEAVTRFVERHRGGRRRMLSVHQRAERRDRGGKRKPVLKNVYRY